MKNFTSVPLILYESEMKHKTSIIRILLALLFMNIIIFGITIYLFMSFINSYDFYGYNQDGNGINNINTGNQGDVLNESKINYKN
jgi:hypothetical protein